MHKAKGETIFIKLLAIKKIQMFHILFCVLYNIKWSYLFINKFEWPTQRRTSPMDLQTPKKLHIEDLLEHYSKQMSVAHNRQYHFGPNGRRVKNEYDMCKLIGVKSLNFPKQLSESSTLQAEKFYNERGWY